MLRGRRGARLTALTSGGTIPDTADYQVVLEPENQVIGTVNEDFAVESMAGDIFQLGNASYRIQRVERGTVRVEDAQRAAADDPLLARRGAGPHRRAFRLRLATARRGRARAARPIRPERVRARLAGRGGRRRRSRRPSSSSNISPRPLRAFGCLPTQDTIVFERFFDEAGGMQLVIHSPVRQPPQSRLGPGAAQALLPQVQFRTAGGGDRGQYRAVADHARTVSSSTRSRATSIPNSVRAVLIQAMLDAPMFTTRWRWVAGVSLALPRFRGGKKVPPQFTRMQAEDLIAAVFPDQIACAENLVGRAGGPRPSADQSGDRRLPQRGDGHRRPGAAARRASKRARSASSPAI